MIPVSLEKAVVCKLTVSGQKFEILVDPYKALELKKNSNIKIEDVLAYPAIYKDARQGEAVSSQDLQKAFGTTDINKIAIRIIKDGELQITTELRRQMIDQKKNQIANIISKRGINPQTNTPHPPQRILNAMEQAGIQIDPFQDAEHQIDKVLKAIKPLLPIKFQKLILQIKVPAQYAGKSYSIIKSFGNIQQENWLGDGSLQANVEILSGLQDDFFEKISSLTHGQFESKILKREDV
ncbi:MAG: ribosome assembly factor SBDS [Candidatus Aenigmatarchaeota archaeon]